MFHGCISPLITPFTKNNEIDKRAFVDLVEWHVQEGTDALVICGTTAETPTLSEDEQFFLIQTAVEVVKGRIPVIAGTGCNNTQSCVEQTEKAMKAGVDGCLVVVPYYNRPTFEGCKAHFQEVAKVGLPMILYYHPGRTGTKLTPKMIAEIAEIKEIAAIKDSSGDLDAVAELLYLTKKPVLSGDDPLILPMMSLGGAGAISIISNVIPNEWKKMVASFALGDVKLARKIFKKYYRLVRSSILESNPQCVKYALSFMGRCENNFRLPMVSPREETQKEIQEALQEVGLRAKVLL
jgi:4-hydroxy-tetrahydrodipicolinate synthase